MIYAAAVFGFETEKSYAVGFAVGRYGRQKVTGVHDLDRQNYAIDEEDQ